MLPVTQTALFDAATNALDVLQSCVKPLDEGGDDAAAMCHAISTLKRAIKLVTYTNVGDVVTFKDRVYEPPFAPYYDAHKGKWFEVVKVLKDIDGELVETKIPFDEADHVELKCITVPPVKVDGYVHMSDLRKI